MKYVEFSKYYILDHMVVYIHTHTHKDKQFNNYKFLFIQDSLDFGTLSVTGYMRGETALSVNNLVHIPGFGDFQMSCIKAPEDPYEITHANRKKRSSDDEMKAEKKAIILYSADPERQVKYILCC